jgi:uncharacterized OB-fold protein
MVPAPYYVALIDLHGGPTIEATSASETDSETIQAGTKVKLVLESLETDDDGEEIAAYRFVPNRNEGSSL